MKVELLTPGGEKLFGDGADEFIAADSMADLKGVFEARALSVPDVPGQSVYGLDIKPFTCTVSAVVWPESGASFQDVWRKVRAAVSVHDYAVLRIDTGATPLFARVRLAAVSPAPSRDIDAGTSREIVLSLACDDGLFYSEETQKTGRVDILNWGDAPIFPDVRWSGSGVTLTLPSGAKVPLPPVPEGERILRMNRSQVTVLNGSGQPDRALALSLGAVWPEGVPVGQTRTYEISSGGTLAWRVGVLDPWR